MLEEFQQIKEDTESYDNLEEFFCKNSAYLKFYTDDTALTKNVCESLINCHGLDLADMAYRFQFTFYKETKNRGYTSGAITLFNKFKKLHTNNQLETSFFLPAIGLFSGEGEN